MADWLNDLFAAIDGKDAESFAEFLTDDARFRFGNSPEVIGKAETRRTVSDFFTAVHALSHRILQVWREPGVVICEGEVTYTRKDGSRLTVPFVNVLKTRASLVSDYRIYVDASALWQ